MLLKAATALLLAGCLLAALPAHLAAQPPKATSDFSFENIAMRAGKPQYAIVLQGFSELSHYTKNLLLRNSTLPDGANVRVSQCDRVRFDQVRTVLGAKPTYEITNAGQIER